MLMTTINTPKLRFPEFKNSGDWKNNKLSKIVTFYNNLRKPVAKHLRVSGEYPYYGANGIIDYIDNYTFDGLYILIGEDGSVINVDKTPIVNLVNGKFWVNNHAHIINGISNITNTLFIFYALQRVNIEYLVKGVPPKLNKVSAESIIIKYPNIEEQTKIANCFSSLDKLIGLEKEKLDKLQEHKKGLMSNLFPNNNEKQPKLRFPEFKNSGDWEEIKIGEICDVSTGNKNAQDKVDNGKYPFFIRSEKLEHINTFSYDGEAILTAGDGKIGEIFHYINDKFDFHQRVYKLSDFFNVKGKFLYYIFSRDFKKRALSMSAKNTVDSVRMEMITEMTIYKPVLQEEQTKIADFLSSLDVEIDNQKLKIEKLEEHKKGLLQKLFI